MAESSDKLNILVLMGGVSNEREVSLLSGAAVADALESRGHTVTRSDITPDDISAIDNCTADVIFIAMHGYFGEDGQLQQLCENRNLAYVGSRPDACRTAMDKLAAKQLFRRSAIATPDWIALGGGADLDEDQLSRIGLPCVIKPVIGGSSLDVCIARNDDDAHKICRQMTAKYERFMVEAFVAGREFTVSVVDDDALDVLEIVPPARREFYDYAAKYDDDDTVFTFDHGLGVEVCQQMQEMALAAHRCLGCRDISRSDFRLDSDNRPWLLEVNIIPGMTGHSLLPKAAERAGIDFTQLCERLVLMARRRTEDKN